MRLLAAAILFVILLGIGLLCIAKGFIELTDPTILVSGNQKFRPSIPPLAERLLAGLPWLALGLAAFAVMIYAAIRPRRLK